MNNPLAVETAAASDDVSRFFFVPSRFRCRQPWIVPVLLAVSSGLPFATCLGDEIARLKDLRIETPLAAKGKPLAAIVAPAGGRYDSAVASVQAAVKKAAGVELPVLRDTAGEPQELLHDRSLIVLGNMSTSRILFTLYRHYYAFTDLKYPGLGGWEVRSLHDPYATGHNVILLGGSDDAGVLAAAANFVNELKPDDPLKVGWLLKVRLGSDVPKPPAIGETVYSWRDSYRQDAEGKVFGQGASGIWGWSPIGKPAALYYMTGDEKYLREFLRLALPDPENLPKEIRSLKVETAIRSGRAPEFGIERPLRMIHHYHSHLMPMLWDLIEESPLLDDATRLKITTDLRVNADFQAGVNRFGTSRHGCYYALSAFTTSRYFDKYYPDPKWKKRLEDVHGNFLWWTKHPTFGESDTLGWINTSIQPVVEYFMLTDPKPYVQSGMARLMMSALETLWTGKACEDSNALQSLNLMHKAAWMLGDGRYAWLARQAGYDENVFRTEQSWWPSEAIPVHPPLDLAGKVSVMPLAKLTADGLGFPVAQGFQFLSFRAGLGPYDSLLLLDGICETGRNPWHVSPILHLRNGGRDLLMRYGNQVSVLRDGLADNHVAKAARLESSHALGGVAFVKTSVPDMTDSLWTRSVLLADDGLTLVADTIAARDDGQFDVAVQWEPASPIEPLDARRAQGGDQRPVTLVSSLPTTLKNVPGPLQITSALAPPMDDLNPKYALRQTLSVTLRKGESRTLINAVYADEAPGTFAWQLQPVAPNAVWITGKSERLVSFGSFDSGDVAIQADAGWVSPRRLVMFRGERIKAGQDLVVANAPVTLSWRLDEGTLDFQSATPVRLGLRLDAQASPAVDGKTIVPERSGALSFVAFSAGQHRLTGVKLSGDLELKAPAPQTFAAETAPSKEASLPAWPHAWKLDLEATIRTFTPAPAGGSGPNGVWLATEDATLRLVSAGGNVERSIRLPSNATAIAATMPRGNKDEGLVLAGTQDNRLRAFTAKGAPLWDVASTVSPVFITGALYDASWFTDPKVITGIRSLLTVETSRGEPVIVLGRPSTVEFWTLQGELVARNPVRWGDCSTLASVTIGGSLRVLVGKFYGTLDTLHVFNDNGKNLGEAYLDPLPKGSSKMSRAFMRGVAALDVADLDGDGKPEVVVVRSGHWNDLRVYSGDGSVCLWQRSFGPGAIRHLQERFGHFVRALAVGIPATNGRREVCVGLENGWTFCFDAAGNPVWRHNFGSGVSSLAVSPAGVAVALDNGDVVLMNSSGQSVRRAKLDAAVFALVHTSSPPGFLAATRPGKVYGLHAAEGR